MYLGKYKITYDKYPEWFSVGISIRLGSKMLILELGFYSITIWKRK